MLYTGFREIDDTLGGIKNGELIVVASDFVGEYVQQYILYNVAKQLDKHNRKNIKNYDEKIANALNFENIDFEKPIEKVIVLGWHDLEFNALSCFPRGEYDAKQFDLFTKRRLLFKDLPIEQSFSYLYQRSANALIKDITHTYEDIKTQVSAICVFGWEKKIPLLKEVAQKLNIPVLLLTYTSTGYGEPLEDEIKKYQNQSANIDKLVIVKNNYWDEKYKDTPNKNASTFYVENFKTKHAESIISKYWPSLSLEIYEGDWGQIFRPSDRAGVFEAMIQNDEYINKNNFDLYLYFDSEKTEQFWAYIKAFQRIQNDDLYELLKEYKKGASKRELIFATDILHKLLIKHTEIEADSLSDDIQF